MITYVSMYMYGIGTWWHLTCTIFVHECIYASQTQSRLWRYLHERWINDRRPAGACVWTRGWRRIRQHEPIESEHLSLIRSEWESIYLQSDLRPKSSIRSETELMRPSKSDSTFIILLGGKKLFIFSNINGFSAFGFMDFFRMQRFVNQNPNPRWWRRSEPDSLA